MNNDINFQESDENNGLDAENGFEPDETEDIDNGEDFNETENAETQTGTADSGAAERPAAASATRGRQPEKEKEKHKLKMPEKFSVSGTAKAYKDYWTGLQTRTKIIAISSLLGTLVLLVILVVVLNYSPWVIAYTGLDDGEAGEMIAILNSGNIQNKWESALKTLSVKEKDQAKAISILAVNGGYPRTGFVYVEETNTNILANSEEKKQIALRNREKKLQAALNNIAGVKDSLVTLNIPDNSGSVLQREYLPPSASVMLQLKQGYTLSDDAVRGIENLIQKSVAKLLIEDIVITDGTGVKLNENLTQSAASKFATIADMKADYERTKAREIRNAIIEHLESIYGSGGVSVTCAVECDYDDLITEAKDYFGTNIDEDGNQTGIKSGVGIDQETGSSDPDDVGYETPDLNPDSDTYYENAGDNSVPGYYSALHYTDERFVNYVFTQSQRTAPEVKYISLSVLVDDKELDPDLEESLLYGMANASGISSVIQKNITEDMDYDDLLRRYITIVAAPFPYRILPGSDIDKTGIIEDGQKLFHMLILLGVAVIVIIILVIWIIAILSGRSREREEAEAEMEAVYAAAAAAASGSGKGIAVDPLASQFGMAAGKYAASSGYDGDDADEPGAIEAKEQNLKRQIKLFAEQNPDIAAQLIRTLIKGDELPSG